LSLSDFLFTPTVQRVLAATLGQPDRTYTLQDLLALAAVGRGSTQLQIERLIAAGVLTEEPRRGRYRAIKANPQHLLYGELRSIMRKTFGVAEPLKECLQPFAARIQEAFVFGSTANGTDSSGSDIDLMVIGSVPLLELAPALTAIESTLGRPVHLSLYEPEEWRDLVKADPVVRQIAAGPKLTLILNAKAT
jgi:uncharacterized protein